MADDNETQPLLEYEYKRSKILYVATVLFRTLCFLTGQYVASPTLYDHKGEHPVYSVLLTVIIYIGIIPFLVSAIIQNIYSFVFDIWVISKCPFDIHCGFLYTLNVTSLSNVTNETNGTNGTMSIQSSPPSIEQFDDWQKAVITTATVSGMLSYLFMVLVLYSQYSCLSKCKDRIPTLGSVCCWIAKEPHHHTLLRTRESEDGNNNLRYKINPFLDTSYKAEDDDLLDPNKKFLSALLTPEQSGYFHFIFLSNLLIYAANVILFFIILSGRINPDGSLLEIFDVIGLIAQFVSQFCAILSCFIFSKVAYAVSNRSLDFTMRIFPMVNTKKYRENVAQNLNNETLVWKGLKQAFFNNGANEDVSHFMILKKIDQAYAKIVKRSLGPYGTWFAIHWVLYTLTAFMSIAYVADIIEMELYKPERCQYEPTPGCRLTLSYAICFALVHCVLFLYPCFRAASVTRARSNMIKSISKAEWRDVPPADKHAFMSYLKDQDCSFKVSILCVDLSFGFNMAYISIFIGILGVVLKVST